jgi:hypothetical protein
MCYPSVVGVLEALGTKPEVEGAQSAEKPDSDGFDDVDVLSSVVGVDGETGALTNIAWPTSPAATTEPAETAVVNWNPATRSAPAIAMSETGMSPST